MKYNGSEHSKKIDDETSLDYMTCYNQVGDGFDNNFQGLPG